LPNKKQDNRIFRISIKANQNRKGVKSMRACSHCGTYYGKDQRFDKNMVCEACRKHVVGKELINVKQAAKLLGYTHKALQRKVQMGAIPHYRFGYRPRFDPEELMKWAAKYHHKGERKCKKCRKKSASTS